MLDDQTVPYFCWDRKLTAGQIRTQLQDATDFEWVRLASWILREAAFRDVWSFLKPTEVRDHLPELVPFLRGKKDFWEYIIGTWHEMGKS